MPNFKNIEYLKHGNKKQCLAYKALMKLGVFEKLKNYSPILTGTIPIEIDLPKSDLDIICQCENHKEFSDLLRELFGNNQGFNIKTHQRFGPKSTVCQFWYHHFEIEIFAQNKPTEKQNAYQHMIIEYKILQEKDAEFREQIIRLKAMGLKTEPAFAKLLNLKGNPYEELLKMV